MRDFTTVLDLVRQHHGEDVVRNAKALNTYLIEDLRTVSDDRFLAEMTRAVFNAGFNWQVIQTKWPGFELAFEGFNPHRVAFYADEALDRLLADTRIVRNAQKIRATFQNAQMVVDVVKSSGGFGAFLETWPDEDQAGLLQYLHKHGGRLGGASAQYFLRFSGYDAWISSRDVCAALMREGVLDKPQATSKTALGKIDQAMSEWHHQSGYSRSVISRLLALSVG